jgi:hypothetical protein
MGFFKTLLKSFSSDQYRRNPAGTALSPLERTALSIGAINAEQTMSFCDTLSTGIDPEELKEKLNDYFGVSDRDSCIDLLHWLVETGHGSFFLLLKDHAASGGAVPLDAEGLPEEAAEKVREYAKNLNDTAKILKEDGWIEGPETFAKMDIRAWDFGRAVMVARSAFDCGYLSEEEAWSLIMALHENAVKNFADWRQFAASYMVGRAMWGGDDMMLSGLSLIAQDLLKDEGSPWVELPLK